MNKKAKRMLIGSGLAAAGLSVARAIHRATTKYFVNVALDREAPQHTDGSGQRLSGVEPEPEYLAQIRAAAEKLSAVPCETVEITGSDGTRLVGHWHPGEQPRRVIIAMHGWRSSWVNDFGAIADFWFDHHCAVLFAEQRGQGESGGDYMGFGLLERYDCLEWVRWVNENGCGALPVYLAGISMGASTVLMAAGLPLPPNVSGIMADCGFTSPAAIWKHVAQDNLGLSYGTRSAVVNDLCRKKIQVGADDYSCVDAMRGCTVPVLFVHGTDDHFVPIEMTYENYKACSAPKRLFVVPGAEHGMSYLNDRAGYEENVLAFWQMCEENHSTG